MTLDDNSTETNQTPAKKPARRRVTRQAAAPQPVSLDAPTQAEPRTGPQVETVPARTTDAAAEPTAGSAASAPKRRGRATRATAAASTTTTPDVPTGVDEGPGGDATAGPGAAADDAAPAKRPAARRSRSRKATSETPEPADPATSTGGADRTGPALDVVASVEAMTASPATEDAAVTEDPEPAPRATRARRSRGAARKQSAPEAAPEVREDPEPAPSGEQDGPDEHTDEPAVPPARSTRTRGSRRATRGSSASPAPEETTQGSDESSTGAAPVTDGAAAEPGAETQDEAQPEETAARAPRTALLFQAPDPEAARPRRRRAQSPAGPPRPVVEDEDAEVEEDEALRPGSTAPDDEAQTEESSTDAAEDTGDDEDTDGTGSPRRRRRRGGRGRRNRGGSDNQRGDDTDDEDDDSDGDDTAEDDRDQDGGQRRSRRRGRSSARSESDDETVAQDDEGDPEDGEDDESGSSRRRRRRRRGSRSGEQDAAPAPSAGRPARGRTGSDEVTALKGSTRLEAKRQRRREGRDAGRRRSIITEAEFLARRESVERSMIVRERNGRTQIAVLEDGVLVEHYVSQQSQASMAGNVYLGRVQNVLPSMEAAFVDVGKGRNAVLYAGEVNWDAVGLEGQPRRIEQALKSGDSVLVQVTKDPIGHKGARLTSQVTLAGRYLVYVPGGGMTGISRKLPDTERARLKKILREVVPETAGVIVRTAAEGASEAELRADIARLQAQWEAIEKKAKGASAPSLLQGEPDLAIRVVRDIFNDDFTSLTVSGDSAWSEISQYVDDLAPDLAERVKRWTSEKDVFSEARIDEQLAKGMDRKVWLPSGGSLVIDRTEAMTVVDVNTGKFTGSGGTLEETVTRNNLEAAEEIVRQLRLRDIGGIIVIDFIDMVLESNRDLVLRRLVECLGRDRTKHQVAEVTSLGLVQMTRKRVGQGLVEAFSETCDHCNGRGFIVHDEPNEKHHSGAASAAPAAPEGAAEPKRARRKRGGKDGAQEGSGAVPVLPEAREAVKATLATIAAAAAHAHEHDDHDAPVEAALTQAAPAGEEDAPAEVDQRAGADDAGPEVEVVPEAGSGPGAERAAALDVVAEIRAAREREASAPEETSSPEGGSTD